MFAVSPARYDRGSLSFASSPSNASQCQAQCGATYFESGQGMEGLKGLNCFEIGHQGGKKRAGCSQPTEQPIVSPECSRDMAFSNRTLLVVSSWNSSPYHIVIDTMFPTFATAAQLAWLQGSRSSDMEVGIYIYIYI